MIQYGLVRSVEQPSPIEITSEMVFIATNIQPYTITKEERTESGYQYNYVGYPKDEYISLLAQRNQ